MGDGPRGVGGVDEGHVDAVASQLGQGVVEDVELLGGGGFVGLVGHRQVGRDPFQPQRRVRLHLLGQGHGVVGVGADAMHAGVELQVDGDLRSAGFGRRRRGVDAVRGVEHRPQPVRDHLGHRGRRWLRQHQDRRVDAGVAELDPLPDQRHAQPCRAGVERGAGHGHRAVAVAVGLDHRPHVGRGHDGAEPADVVADGGQVHLGPGPALGRGHQRGQDRGDEVGEVAGHQAPGRAELGGRAVDPGAEGRG